MSDIMVSNAGTPSAPYNTWATAFIDIQSAIDYASTGDVIRIDSGSYYISATIVVSKGITVTSRYGKELTIINGGGTVRCMTVLHADAEIRNLTITNGNATYEPGVKLPFGGGVLIEAGLVYGCDIKGNQAYTRGGGVSVQGTASRLSHCIISDNECYYYGGGVGIWDAESYQIAVDNCLVYGNRQTGGFPGEGGGIYGDKGGYGRVVNCTISDNVAASQRGGGVSGCVLENCIVHFNYTSWGAPQETYESSLQNCYLNNPDFVDRLARNYRTHLASPCINAGGPIDGIDEFDLDGNPRVIDDIIDIGAYEQQVDLLSSSTSESSVSSQSLSSESTQSSQSSLSTQTSDSSLSSISSHSSSSTSRSSRSSASSQTSISSASSFSSLSSSSKSSSSTSSSVYDGVVFEPAGEAYACPSLVVDILNLPELVADTKSAFGSAFRQQLGWVAEDRLRGDMSTGMAKWGFKQANGKTSNAVVLTGEKVVIHIASKGHGVGYSRTASEGPIFSRTRIRITLHDTYRNVEKSVVFDSFSIPVSDPNRYIMWQVGDYGSWCEQSRTDTGVCGVYVLTVSDESIFYHRADWTDEVVLENGMSFPRSESCLQVVAYEWRDALGNIVIDPSRNSAVMTGVEFRTSPIDPHTTGNEASVFDSHTIFPLYESSNGMNAEQKSIVLRDNAMTLMSSQGPILPADAPHAQILGIGMTPINMPSDKNMGVSIRPAAAIEKNAEPRRTFSLSGRPAATNVLDELGAFVSDHNQGDFVFCDPVLATSFDVDGEASGELDGGLAWVTSGVRTTGMTLTTGGSSQTEISLCDEGYELSAE